MNQAKFKISSIPVIITGIIFSIITLTGCAKKQDTPPLSKKTPQQNLSISNINPASGTYLTVVTISGSGFSEYPDSNIVRFNKKQAIVISTSSTQIVVRAPLFYGHQPVRVTVQKGNKIVRGPDFYYYIPIIDPLPPILEKL